MQESKAIPKFASFKAKPSPAPEDVKKSTRVDDESRDDEKSRHRSRHRSHHHRSSSRHKQERLKSHVEQEPSRSADAVKEDLQDLYKIDRKGDIHNIVYGTIHRYSIPQYRRTGCGSVLGLSPQCKIDRAYEGEDYIVIRKDDWVADGSRHKTKSLLWRSDIKSQDVFRIRQTSKQAYDGASQSYIPLVNEVSRKRRRVSNGHEIDISDDEADKYGYRSILGKAKDEDDVPSDMEKHEESDTDEENIALKWNREANQHNSELLKRAEANPGDVNAWLELIKYQVILLSGSDSHRQLTSAEQRSLADIKLSLYEKALKRIGKGTAKDRLLLGYLEEGSKIWESARLAEQWHAILKNNPGYISLWMRYIDFRQTSFLDFTFERCTDVYLECMKLNASSDREEKELIQAYLFLRMTLLMREAGYTELAVGLWQAVLEFTLFRPLNFLNSSESEILESFHLFWESEVARLGEPGSKGWSSGRSSELEPVETNAVTSIEPQTLFLHWSEEERRLSRSSHLPARTVDIVENDDPFRVVLWSDISPYLSFFTSWQRRDILVDEFLKFCYLPILYQQTSSSGGNAFLRNEILYLRDSCLDKMINPSPDQLQRRHVFDSTPLHNLVHSVDTLFANDDWIQSMSTWKEIVQNPEATIDGEWIRRCLKQLVGVSPHDDNLAELALGVEHTLNANEGKKYAKSLLKKRPSSLRLYNAFALMESRSGNFASASHVWAATFSMAANLSEEQRLQYATIIRSWTWDYLAAGRMESAVQVLVSSADYAISLESLHEDRISAVTPAQRLKTERFLFESADHSLAINDLQAFTAWTDLVALSHYLLGSLDLASSLDVYKTSFNRLANTLLSDHDKSYALELLHQSRARILYYHITSRRAYKPGVVRALLVESTRTFPHNTLLLSLFTWNESRFRVDERLRSSVPLSSSSLSNTDLINQPVVTSSLIDIFAELNRPIYTGSTVYSARAAFERALQVSVDFLHSSSSSSSSSSSPSLWKLYIAFELYRAKDVNVATKAFYRALRACPWSRDIVMLAFNFRSSLDAGAGVASASASGSGSQVKEPVAEILDGVDKIGGTGGENVLVDDWWESCKIYNVLLDKGLRVHVEIDDEMLKQGEMRWIEAEAEMEQNQRLGVDGKDAWMARRRKDVIDLPDDADASDQLS